MSTIPLGGLLRISDSLSIGRLGFGAARILGGRELRTTSHLIEAALSLGIRHFDTAPSYGDGQSEGLLGDILAGVPDITITTKIGISRLDPAARQSFAKSIYRHIGRPVLSKLPALKAQLLTLRKPSTGLPAIHRKLEQDEVRRELDISTRLLRRTPDIFLLHEPAGLVLDDELLRLFNDLLAEGRFKAFGSGSGAQLAPELIFGTVAQGLYAPDLQPLEQVKRICHGVLRQPPREMSPAQSFQKAVSESPDIAFLVSASRPGQLRDLAALL